MSLYYGKDIKYQKYELLDFTQPTLTSNGTLGGSSFACSESGYYESAGQEDPQKAWYLFSSEFTGTSATTKNEWQINDVSTSTWYWMIFYNPNPLVISKINVGISQATYQPVQYKWYGSNDNSSYTLITSSTTQVSADYSSFDISFPSNYTITGYKYYKLEVLPKSTTAIMISRLKLYAKYYTGRLVEGSNTEYDIKIPTINKIYPPSSLELYKKETFSFVQPTLSSNGTIGGNSFAVSASSELDSPRLAYCAFDNATDSTGESKCWHSAQGLPAWIQFYNPQPLKISKLTITNRGDSGAYLTNFGLAYSDDGATFTEFYTGTHSAPSAYGVHSVSINQDFHKYWRINCYTSSGDNSTYVAIDEIDIEAVYFTGNYKPREIVKVYKGNTLVWSK